MTPSNLLRHTCIFNYDYIFIVDFLNPNLRDGIMIECSDVFPFLHSVFLHTSELSSKRQKELCLSMCRTFSRDAGVK